MKKKKVISGIVLVIVCVAGFIGYEQYKKHQDNKNQEYRQVLAVYNAVEVEGYRSNPLLQGMTVDELKKNPPKVEMNGWRGLYISAMAYEYYTKKTVDYLEIEEWMNTGQALKVYEKYQDYIDWLNDPTHDNRDKYATTIISISGNLDSESSYWDYKNIITDPELSKQLADRLSKQSGA